MAAMIPNLDPRLQLAGEVAVGVDGWKSLGFAAFRSHPLLQEHCAVGLQCIAILRKHHHVTSSICTFNTSCE
jgi:hypothetical protein